MAASSTHQLGGKYLLVSDPSTALHSTHSTAQSRELSFASSTYLEAYYFRSDCYRFSPHVVGSSNKKEYLYLKAPSRIRRLLVVFLIGLYPFCHHGLLLYLQCYRAKTQLGATVLPRLFSCDFRNRFLSWKDKPFSAFVDRSALSDRPWRGIDKVWQRDHTYVNNSSISVLAGLQFSICCSSCSATRRTGGRMMEDVARQHHPVV